MTQPLSAKCIVCGSSATISGDQFFGPFRVDCPRCGRFSASKEFWEDWPNDNASNTSSVRLSHLIRRRSSDGECARLNRVRDILDALENFNLPTPAESLDLLIEHVGDKTKDAPGKFFYEYSVPLAGIIGMQDPQAVHWILEHANSADLLSFKGVIEGCELCLSMNGWGRYGEIKRARSTSNFAFFARRFENKKLDDIAEKALKPAVKRTGYDLRMVSQKAGLIDAIMEHEIRACKFLISDLSDGNAGAYWEAGFAEGLGKKVIYICDEAKKKSYTSTRTTEPRSSGKSMIQRELRIN